MNMPLSDSQVRQYQSEGYVVARDLLDDTTVERVRTRLEKYAGHGADDLSFTKMLEPDVDDSVIGEETQPVRKFEGLDMVREDTVFNSLAHNERILSIVKQLQGPNLKLLRSAAMMKPPNVGSEKKFHQDAAYYPIQPRDHVTVWIAVDEATEDNGCMRVIPGAHTDGLLQHEAMEYETDITLTETDFDRSDTVALPMEPGSVLFQHCLLPHYTDPNRTEDWRRAFILAYMRGRSRFTDEEPPEWVDTVHVAGTEFPGCV